MMRDYSPAPRTAQPHRLVLANCSVMRPNSALRAVRTQASATALLSNARVVAKLSRMPVGFSQNINDATASNISAHSVRVASKKSAP